MTDQRAEVDETDHIPLGPALFTWFTGVVIGMLLVAGVVVALIADDPSDLSVPELAAATVPAWLVFVAALGFTSRRYGSGRPAADFRRHYGVGFEPIDLIGVPLGVATQLVLVPLLYAPLRAAWPATFSKARLDERATDLADRAGGWKTALLVLVVVVGAPLVEELVYRGLVQRSLTRAAGPIAALLLTSVLFAIVHPSPVEYPGLLLAGLVFGSTVTVTDRLGPSWLTHGAFNAAGLWFALR